MSKHTSLFFALALTVASGLVGTTAANAAPLPAEIKTGDFAVGVQAYTFHNFTLFEGVEKAAHAGAKVIEFYPGQTLSKDDKAKFGHNISEAQIAAVKALLNKFGVVAVNYGVVDIPNDEQKARQIFDFAKKMGFYALSTESTDSIDIIEKLAKEYDIRVGFHNHPRQPKNAKYKVWDAQYVRDLVKDRDPRIGAAADVGHWATDNFNAVENLKILEGRLISIHAKDRPEVGPRARTKDVALGTGALNFPAILDELKRQNFQGNISIEHESNWKNNVPEVAAGIGFVRGYAAGKK
ncbi:MAG: sugar phosphate isomerase/epimerase [Puniceicoccales bacterium]|jgi:sugar phosphate isomerase/epimerase|nr:sugar phosphate isomerase/epimerase [Puniceicoccales bacterium]